MINLLPIPWSWIASAFLNAILTWVVPKITDATMQNLVKGVIQFLLTGTPTAHLQVAAQAHSDSQASVARAPELKKT